MGSSTNERGNRRLRESFIGSPGVRADGEFPVEDDDENEDFLGGNGFMQDLDFFSWDLILKNTPKLPGLELLMHKN